MAETRRFPGNLAVVVSHPLLTDVAMVCAAFVVVLLLGSCGTPPSSQRVGVVATTAAPPRSPRTGGCSSMTQLGPNGQPVGTVKVRQPISPTPSPPTQENNVTTTTSQNLPGSGAATRLTMRARTTSPTTTTASDHSSAEPPTAPEPEPRHPYPTYIIPVRPCTVGPKAGTGDHS